MIRRYRGNCHRNGQIKIQLAKAGVDIRIFGDDVSVEKIAEVLGSAGVGQIEAALCVTGISSGNGAERQ